MRPILIAALISVSLAGCVQRGNPNVYDPYEVGQAAYVETGVIQSIRPVTVESPGGTGIGATVGALAGGLAGAQIGPSRYRHRGHSHRYTSAGSALGAIGGAVIGGLIGAAFERDLTRQNGTEYTVRLDDGTMVTIVQTSDRLAPGQRVTLQTGPSGRARLVPTA